MPNITPANNGLTLDDLRRNPGQLVFPNGLAEIGVFRSYDAITRAVETGRLPKPYKLGQRSAWEGRAILRMVGASAAIPEDDGDQPAAPTTKAP